MIEQRGQELVVGCLAASAAVSAASSLATGEVPGMRMVVGYAFTAVGLATLSMGAPGLAAGGAVLILTTTVFVYGQPLWDAVTAFTGTPSSSTPQHPAQTPTQEGSTSV